jgi:hypothetical protein
MQREDGAKKVRRDMAGVIRNARHRQEIQKQDRSVEAETSHGLQHDLGGELRVETQVQE